VQNYDFEAMRNIDIRAVDPDTLADIRDIKIDPNLPLREKALDYLMQSNGNAYFFKYDGVIVKISHSQAGISISECVEGFLRLL